MAGRGVQHKNSWAISNPPISSSGKGENELVNKKTENNANTMVDKKFKEIHKKHLEAAKKLVKDYESSSDEEEISTEDIFNSVFKSYNGNTIDLEKTRQFLDNAFQSGGATCLICIGTVKRADPIWSCYSCYCFFHLPCIQRWANDSLSQRKLHQETEVGYYNNRGEFISKHKKPITWACPQCRCDYQPNEIPRHYECFCGKEINPPVNNWLVPHSCGEICERQLISGCGHKCQILCHPGICPPCPQIIITSCECGQEKLKAIRCSQRTWNCNKKCQQILSCGTHKCDILCHKKNECPPCQKRSTQKCVCGNKVQERNCYESIWHCTKVCGKPYKCGLHKCEKICHADDCDECPLGLPRYCPCGKQQSIASCSEQIESCGDTCQKPLECGIHVCLRRCHKGPCDQCLERVEKKCKCGLHLKELPCYKIFTCETKCKQLKDCAKHYCSRKCCDGNCPPCDRICGKTLSCGKHKCKSLCHNGPCYPCNLKASVKCRCNGTVIEVPCGREKKTKSPKCLLPCRLPSKCHHENPHNCHPNDCPSCYKKCNLENDTTNCSHLCDSKCHDYIEVKTMDKNFKPVGPWDVRPEIVEFKKLPHPSCNVKVPVTCIGGHETYMWPCSDSKPRTCGRICGRPLKCGNHQCQLECHLVKNSQSSEEDDSCAPCQSECRIARPNGCSHPCKRPCHIPPCSPCSIVIRMPCHCSLTQVIFKCGDFFKDANEKKSFTDLLSCNNPCIKSYPCGHRCTSNCHIGPCPDPDFCKKKVKVKCPCHTRKIEMNCNKARAGLSSVQCDDVCRAKKEELERIQKEKQLKEEQEEMEKNRIELELYEKKFGKKNPRERKKHTIEVKETTNWKLWALAGLITISIAIASYFIVAQ